MDETMENLKPLHALIAAVCPILGVASDGRVQYVTQPTPKQEAQVAQILADWPATKAALLAQREARATLATADKADYRQSIATAITRLDDIVTNGGTYTNTQVRTAVVDMAQILRAVVKATRHLL